MRVGKFFCLRTLHVAHTHNPLSTIFRHVRRFARPLISCSWCGANCIPELPACKSEITKRDCKSYPLPKRLRHVVTNDGGGDSGGCAFRGSYIWQRTGRIDCRFPACVSGETLVDFFPTQRPRLFWACRGQSSVKRERRRRREDLIARKSRIHKSPPIIATCWRFEATHVPSRNQNVSFARAGNSSDTYITGIMEKLKVSSFNKENNWSGKQYLQRQVLQLGSRATYQFE